MSTPVRVSRALLVALLLGGGAVAAYWYFAVRPRLLCISGTDARVETGKAARLSPRVDAASDFDRVYALPAAPLGLAAHGTELIAGDRGGGVLRVRPLEGGELEAVPLKIREPDYGQAISFAALASDGARLVGVADGSWFGGSGRAFTLHDARTLRLLRHAGAPPLVGCLAWDGARFWAATRKNTETSAEEAFLYRLDPSFAVAARYPAPGPGCQGMAWDGARLWTADVFTGRITVLDVAGGEPAVVSSNQTRFRYLSGLAVLAGDVWIAEYGDRTLCRLNPRVASAWRAGAAGS